MVCFPLPHRPGYRFGPFGLKSDGTLLIDHRYVHLPPKELRVLRVLLSRPGQLIDQDTLIDEVWSGGDVACESLTRCIYSLRKILGEHKSLIATVYGKGYRFEGTVTEVFGEFETAPVRLRIAPRRCTHARRIMAVGSAGFRTVVQLARMINAPGQGRFALRIIRSGLRLYKSLVLPASGACAPFPCDRRRVQDAGLANTSLGTART